MAEEKLKPEDELAARALIDKRLNRTFAVLGVAITVLGYLGYANLRDIAESVARESATDAIARFNLDAVQTEFEKQLSNVQQRVEAKFDKLEDEIRHLQIESVGQAKEAEVTARIMLEQFTLEIAEIRKTMLDDVRTLEERLSDAESHAQDTAGNVQKQWEEVARDLDGAKENLRTVKEVTEAWDSIAKQIATTPALIRRIADNMNIERLPELRVGRLVLEDENGRVYGGLAISNEDVGALFLASQGSIILARAAPDGANISAISNKGLATLSMGNDAGGGLAVFNTSETDLVQHIWKNNRLDLSLPADTRLRMLAAVKREGTQIAALDSPIESAGSGVYTFGGSDTTAKLTDRTDYKFLLFSTPGRGSGMILADGSKRIRSFLGSLDRDPWTLTILDENANPTFRGPKRP